MPILENNSQSLLARIFTAYLGYTQEYKKYFVDPKRVGEYAQKYQKPEYKILPKYIERDFKVETKTKVGKDGYEMVYHILDQRDSTNQTVIFLHGGGFAMEIQAYHWYTVSQLAKLMKCRFIVPIYPLIPKYDHTYAYPGLVEIYKDELSRSSEPKISIAGDSCGGQMALYIAQLLKKQQLTKPYALALLSPVSCLECNSKGAIDLSPQDPISSYQGAQEMGRLWAGESASPSQINAIKGDMRDLSEKTLIMYGGLELFGPDNVELYNKLEEAGADPLMIVYKKMPHIWFQINVLPDCRPPQNQVAAFLKNESIEKIDSFNK